MKELEEKLLEGIKNFEFYVMLTRDLFEQQFEINKSPILAAAENSIPKNGELIYKDKKIQYSFHGNGCRFIFEGEMIIDFNYSPTNWEYEGFSFFKFWEFIRSQIPEFEDKKLLERYLKELEQKGIIKRIDPLYATYRFVKE